MVRVVVSQYIAASLGQVDRTVSKIRGFSGQTVDTTIALRVGEIIDQVRESGDDALIQLTRKFDSPKIKDSKSLKVSPSEIKHAYSKISDENLRALRIEAKQISQLAKQQMTRFRAKTLRSPLGFVVKERYVPFNR
ncbi:MAG TPA: histidinol dehydrogenase, partial [Nitrososphaerales archaeon]|nr:histidinol dehydrogenase [Nitrososphaerales archaeon]